MITAQVLTPYVGAGTEDDPYRPLLIDVYAVNMRDVTELPVSEIKPQVNLLTVQITCSVSTINAILLNTSFFVLWWQENV